MSILAIQWQNVPAAIALLLVGIAAVVAGEWLIRLLDDLERRFGGDDLSEK